MEGGKLWREKTTGQEEKDGEGKRCKERGGDAGDTEGVEKAGEGMEKGLKGTM